MEPVFRGIEIAAKAVVAATGTRITYRGLEHIPDTGGAVIAMLQQTATDQLHVVQEDYPHPTGEYWVPSRLGGAAPTPEEAEVLEKAERARREAGDR